MAHLHVVELKDGTYGVEVSRPRSLPLVITSYASETEAFTRLEELRKWITAGESSARAPIRLPR
jgi:hypothetical protein